jgi:hypothetical protein
MGIKQFFSDLFPKSSSTGRYREYSHQLLLKSMAENHRVDSDLILDKKEVRFSEDFKQIAVFEAAQEAKQKVYDEASEEAWKKQTEWDKMDLLQFCENGIQDGLIKREWVANGLIEFMSHLAEDYAVFEFSEGTPRATRLEWFKDFLKEVHKLTSGK